MKKITYVLLCIIAAGSLVACRSLSNSNMEPVKYASGYFVVSKNGVSEEFSDDKNSVKLNWYTDGLCPDCARVHTNTKSFIKENIENGNIEIKYHFLNFLPQHSKTDYPLRSAAWTLGVANYSPEHVEEFMTNIMDKSQEVKPDDRDDKYIENLAVESGVNKDQIQQIYKSMEELKSIINDASKDIRNNQDLLAKSKKGRMFVPFIYVEGGDCALDGESENTNCEIQKPIEKFIKDLKIKPCSEDAPCEE